MRLQSNACSSYLLSLTTKKDEDHWPNRIAKKTEELRSSYFRCWANAFYTVAQKKQGVSKYRRESSANRSWNLWAVILSHITAAENQGRRGQSNENSDKRLARFGRKVPDPIAHR